MNTIDRIVKLMDRYDLKFTIKSVVMAEKELVGHSILQVMANLSPEAINSGRMFGLGDIYTLMKWGLLGANAELSAEKIDEIFGEAVDIIGVDGVAKAALGAVAKSGLVKFKERKNQSAPEKTEQD